DGQEQDRELELAGSETDRRDENSDRDGEVDPQVPLRPDRVHDSLGREVEALEERLAALPCHVREYASSRASISSPWSYPSRWRSRCTSGRLHSSPTTAGHTTTSPSARGMPAGSSSRPSRGNDRTSVASSIPRCSRFRVRISSGPTQTSPSSPSDTPSEAS